MKVYSTNDREVSYAVTDRSVLKKSISKTREKKWVEPKARMNLVIELKKLKIVSPSN